MEKLASSARSVVATKPFTMRGIEYKVGDPVDVSQLPDSKVTQLLNQRYLRPALNVGADNK